MIFTLFALSLNTDLLGKVPASPTNMYNFTNASLNKINIDETYHYNYVAALSENGFGTKPDAGWQNIVNFYSVHFATQIAFSCHKNTNANRTVKVWVRERYTVSGYGDCTWSDWVAII